MLWFAVPVIGSVWNFIAPWPLPVWSHFWFVVGIGIPVFFAFVTAAWFTWGGIRDIRRLFFRLRQERPYAEDNGMAVDHHNRSDSGNR